MELVDINESYCRMIYYRFVRVIGLYLSVQAEGNIGTKLYSHSLLAEQAALLVE